MVTFLTTAMTTKFESIEIVRNSKTLKQGYHFRNDKKCQKSDLKLTSKLILIFVKKLQISFTTEKEKRLSEVTLSPDAFFYMEELYLFIGFKKDIYNRIKIYLYICL